MFQFSFFCQVFLISGAYEKNKILLNYFRNRILRLYPALLCTLLVSIISVFIFSKDNIEVSFFEFFRWVFAQATGGQFFNPEFLRGYGVGVLNGSLWTIAVELQFYILIPILYRVGGEKNIKLISFIVLFLIISLFLKDFSTGSAERTLIIKLIHVSFLPWFWMFLLGVFVQRNILKILPLIEGRWFLYLGAFALCLIVSEHLSIKSTGNGIHPVPFVFLIALVLSLAFSKRNFSDKFLKRNDISYGTYILHMPIINVFVELNYVNSLGAVTLACVITLLLAITSWKFVEKPAMHYKRYKNETTSYLK